MRVCLVIAVLFLTGCLEFLDTKTLFGISEGTTIAITLDKAAGHYNPLPSSLEVTFPSIVDISTVTSSHFTITDTCTSSNPSIGSVSFSGQVATLAIGNTSGCANGETYVVTVSFEKVELTEKGKKGEGSKSYTYTFDNAGTTATVAVKTVSGIAVSGSYVFNTLPTSVTYSFSSDVDMSSVSTTSFSIAGAGLDDCSTMPTITSVTKNASAGTVAANLSGVCASGESFKISLASDAIADATKDGGTAAASPNYGPAADIDITILVDSTGVAVVEIGSGSTTADGTYGVAATIDVQVSFDGSVDVTGTPRLKLNTAPIKYATYASGTGTADLIFQYTTAYGDSSLDLDYSATNSLQLNGGTITRTNSGGAVNATLTLPAPGAAYSLGYNRAIIVDTDVPIITTTSPTGTTNQWGLTARTVSYTMNKEIDPTSLADSDLTVDGITCATPPAVTSSSLSGGSNNVVNFDLSDTACADGEVYTISFDPADVTDLSANAGYGTTKVLTVTVRATTPTITVSAPSKTYVNESGTLIYTVTYSGASSVTLADGDLTFGGAGTGCAGVVTGGGTTTRTITVTGCQDNGAVQMEIAAGTAINTYGNLAAAVDESAITDFNADNTELADPTSNLVAYGSNTVYEKDTLSNFTLTFASDILGVVSAIQSALTFQCNNGGGMATVSQTTSRTSDTVATIAPNEASADFVYGATCEISGTDVPDAAGNLHSFSALTFFVGETLVAQSGPSGLVSLATATGAGDLGTVDFNVALDTSTLDNTNVTLTCDGQDITLSSLTTDSNNTSVTIDFDETDAEWLALIGGETCSLVFSTAVTNSLGMPLASPATFSFTTEP